MARGVNKVILVGNCGQDPETRYSANGAAITNLSLATSETWKDKQTGQPQERTEWHRVVFFNRLGEIAGEYIKKGSKIYVEGSLRTRKWQDQQGQDRYTTEIVASEMQMLDSRQQSGGYEQNATMGAPVNNTYQNTPPAPQAQPHAPQSQPQQPSNQQPSGTPPQAPVEMDNFDDDIPF